MTVLCARAGCVHRGHHAADCADERCAGCQPWPAADGLELCQHHAGRIGPDAVALGELYDELGYVLMPSGGGGERVGGRGDDGPPVPRDRVVAVRSEIRHVLVSWCRLVAEERGVSLPGGPGNGPESHGEPRSWLGGSGGRRDAQNGAQGVEPSCRELAAYVATHAEWLAAHSGVAGEVSEELDELRRRAWTVAYPTGTKVVEVGPCPRVVVHGDKPFVGDAPLTAPCTGTLRAIVRPADQLLPSEVVCSADAQHRWDSTQWRQLDKLISGRRAA